MQKRCRGNRAGRPGGRRSTSALVGLCGLALSAFLGLAAGVGGVLVLAGLYLALCGVWGVVSRRSWVGAVTRRAAAGAVATGLVMAVAGGAVAAGTPVAGPRTEASTTSSQTGPPPSPRPTAAPSATHEAAPPAPAPEPQPQPQPHPAVEQTPPLAPSSDGTQTALEVAAALPVKGRAPKTGYDRDRFGNGWLDPDRNGCDTRNDVLRRDLTGTVLKPGTNGCVVLTGDLADPYSGTTIAFVRGSATSTRVQIDHVVALSDAWQKGAQSWDDARRTAFANDPVNLLAVDGPLNMQKGDGDTATWLPPNHAFRCEYVARQVGVKQTYGLWVTAAERDAMVRVLSSCPGQPLPDGAAAPAPAPVETSPPAHAAPVVPVPVPAPPAATAPYDSCAAARTAGAAPVRSGDPGYGRHLDRDGDGVGCES